MPSVNLTDAPHRQMVALIHFCLFGTSVLWRSPFSFFLFLYFLMFPLLCVSFSFLPLRGGDPFCARALFSPINITHQPAQGTLHPSRPTLACWHSNASGSHTQANGNMGACPPSVDMLWVLTNRLSTVAMGQRSAVKLALFERASNQTFWILNCVFKCV